MLEKVELLDCLFVAVIVWLPLLIHAPIGRHAKRYRMYQPHVASAPPAVAIMILEVIFFGLITAAEIIHYLDLPGSGNPIGLYDQLIVCFFVINVFFAHAWGVAFFRMCKPGISILVSFLAWATAVIVLAFYGVQAFDGALSWVPFILYIFYVVWLTCLFVINAIWLFGLPPKDCRCKVKKAAKKCRYCKRTATYAPSAAYVVHSTNQHTVYSS